MEISQSIFNLREVLILGHIDIIYCSSETQFENDI